MPSILTVLHIREVLHLADASEGIANDPVCLRNLGVALRRDGVSKTDLLRAVLASNIRASVADPIILGYDNA